MPDNPDPPVEELMEKLIPQARAVAWKHWHGAPYVLEFDELLSLAYKGLAEARARWPLYCAEHHFDPARTRFFSVYCVTPGTPVLTAGLDWVPAGDLTVGQELVGVDEDVSGRQRRHFRPSLVQQAERRSARCLVLRLSDGREVTCTTDHLWLVSWRVRGSSAQYCWRPAGLLRPGMRLFSPLRPWSRDESRDGGWLAGVVDGGGCYVRLHDQVRGYQVGQDKGAMLDKVCRVLDNLDLPYAVSRPAVEAGVRVNITQAWAATELAGRLRMERLPGRPVWEGRSAANRLSGAASEVASVTDAGVREVVTLETSTHTYLANGLVAHNCLRRMNGAILDYKRAQDWASRTERGNARLLRDAGQDQGVSEADMSVATGLSRAEVSETLAAMARRPVGFDPVEHDVPDNADTESHVVVSDLLDAAVSALEAQPVAVQFCTVLVFYCGLTPKQAASVLGLQAAEVTTMMQQGALAVHSALARAAGDR
jgi:hypothetical protein